MAIHERITDAIQTYIDELPANIQEEHPAALFVIEWITPARCFILKKRLFIAASVHSSFILETAERLIDMGITDQDTFSIYLENPQDNTTINRVKITLSTDSSLSASSSLSFFQPQKDVPNMPQEPPLYSPVKSPSKLSTIIEELEEETEGLSLKK